MPKHVLSTSVLGLLWIILAISSSAQEPTLISICPEANLEARAATFETGGMILTAFDRNNIWVYDIDRNTRYPLPGTAPCGQYCNLSPDAMWFTFLDASNGNISKMRLNGASITPLAENASEVNWWSEDTLLIWTRDQQAFLQSEGTDESQLLMQSGLLNVQPGGQHAVILIQTAEIFNRVLVNLEAQEGDKGITLAADMRYFSATSWSDDGTSLAYTAPVITGNELIPISTELFVIDPEGTVHSSTNLTEQYGPIRINGHSPGELSWSPDGSKLAFWVTPLTSANPAQTSEQAALHVFDVETGEINTYCGYSTVQHTPNPPRLNWSPEGSHIAFGADLPNDPRGYLLLALNIENGIFTILSTGIYPATGAADVIAWGLLPS